MKILLTGGGTGGHFYPIAAVIRSLRKIAEKEKLVEMELIYMSDAPFDENFLREERVRFLRTPAGKARRYFSLLNLTDFFKTALGILSATLYVFKVMPDVVFSKGGHVSFPALVAARIFGIPVIIHESDAVPGRVNRWAGSFAKRAAVAFPESAKFFPAQSTALVGNPIRKNVLGGNIEEAEAIFGYEKIPTLLVLGGSQGAKKINDVVVDILPELLKETRVIHQSGKANFDEVKKRVSVILSDSGLENRYKLFPFLDENTMRAASFLSKLIVSRAGAGAIFEIAGWGKPSVLIPIKDSAQDHQRENAYAYARTGAAVVVEEGNLTPHILLGEIQKLLTDEKRRKKMGESAKSYARPDAADTVAKEIISLALEHAR